MNATKYKKSCIICDIPVMRKRDDPDCCYKPQCEYYYAVSREEYWKRQVEEKALAMKHDPLDPPERSRRKGTSGKECNFCPSILEKSKGCDGTLCFASCTECVCGSRKCMDALREKLCVTNSIRVCPVEGCKTVLTPDLITAIKEFRQPGVEVGGVSPFPPYEYVGGGACSKCQARWQPDMYCSEHMRDHSCHPTLFGNQISGSLLCVTPVFTCEIPEGFQPPPPSPKSPKKKRRRKQKKMKKNKVKVVAVATLGDYLTPESMDRLAKMDEEWMDNNIDFESDLFTNLVDL